MCEKPKHGVDADCRFQCCFGKWYFLMFCKVVKEEQVGGEKVGGKGGGGTIRGAVPRIAHFHDIIFGEGMWRDRS